MTFIRIACGIVFLLAGTFKLFALGSFADVLRQSGSPLPELFAIAVPLAEIGGGAALLKNVCVRPVASVLAIEMLFAIWLVGAPGTRGVRFRAGNFSIGGEAWRIPLEIGLLYGLVALAARRKKDV